MHAIKTSPPRKLIRQTRRTADLSHNHFRLVVGQKGEASAGIAYAGKTPVFHAEGGSPDEVSDHLKAQIDADLAERRQRQPSDWSTADFALALHLVSAKMNPLQTHALQRIGQLDGDAISLDELVWPSSFSNDAMQRAFSRLLKMIVQALDPKTGKSSEAAREAIVQFAGDAGDGPWRFTQAFRGAAREFVEGGKR